MNILTPLFFSKILISIILAVFLYYAAQTILYGTRISGISNGTSPLHSTMKSKYLIRHQKYAKRSFWILMLAVAVIETTVRLNEPVYDALFWVHLLAFAIPGVVLFQRIVFKYTGLEYPKIHGKLIYRGLLPAFFFILLTGIPLLYRL